MEKINTFLESRSPRDKSVILVAFFAVILALDYFVWLNPLMAAYAKNIPQLKTLHDQRNSLQDDLKNKQKLESDWARSSQLISEKKSQFVKQTEIPSLLEKLSHLARASGVKIISIKPLDQSDSGMGFTKVPIRMTAVAGIHEFGSFLNRLEGGPIFFRVSDLSIASNTSDERRHVMDLGLETYASNL